MVHLAAKSLTQEGRPEGTAMRKSKFLLLAAAMLAWPLSAQHAKAQTFPERPITLVVAFAPGTPEEYAAFIDRDEKKWSPDRQGERRKG
jgi:hypothetical protein